MIKKGEKIFSRYNNISPDSRKGLLLKSLGEPVYQLGTADSGVVSTRPDIPFFSFVHILTYFRHHLFNTL